MKRSLRSVNLKQMAAFQGLFYTVSGLWPILDIQSFEAVTGPKTDRWLVKTVGALLAVTGGVLLASSRRKKIPEEIILIAAAQAAALTLVDINYSLKGRISKVYLLDAAAEILLIAAWTYAKNQEGRQRIPPEISSQSLEAA